MKKRDLSLEVEEIKVQLKNFRYFCEQMQTNEKFRSFAKQAIKALIKLEIRLQKISDKLKNESFSSTT